MAYFCEESALVRELQSRCPLLQPGSQPATPELWFLANCLDEEGTPALLARCEAAYGERVVRAAVELACAGLPSYDALLALIFLALASAPNLLTDAIKFCATPMGKASAKLLWEAASEAQRAALFGPRASGELSFKQAKVSDWDELTLAVFDKAADETASETTSGVLENMVNFRINANA